MLQNYLRTSGPFDLILGDFNLPHIDWKTQTSSTHLGETYIELFQDLFLHQHVEEPTHDRGNVLDLVFTQDESLIHDIRCLKEESISDHYPILIELNMFNKNQNLGLNHYDYKHMNKELFRNMLSDIDWTSQLNTGSANDMWIALKEHIQSAMSLCIPIDRILRSIYMYMYHTVPSSKYRVLVSCYLTSKEIRSSLLSSVRAAHLPWRSRFEPKKNKVNKLQKV